MANMSSKRSLETSHEVPWFTQRLARCSFPFRNISILKLLSDKLDLFALLMSLPRENKRSTAALEGTAVLYLKKIIKIVNVRFHMKKEYK